MTKEYQRQKNNPYTLERTVYQRALWAIRDYERLKADRNEIIYAKADNQPMGAGGIGRPTESKAIKLAEIEGQLKAIDQALFEVEEDMRQGILNNICYQAPYPHYPSRRTWSRAKAKLIHQVAQNLKLI